MTTEKDEPVFIPGFRIHRELGRGAMGVVYLAEEPALGRHVALKVLRADFASTSDNRARFEREVRAAARLRHPNIVPVLSTGEADGHLWYTMEYVGGPSLDAVLRASETGRLRRARAARIVHELARALDDAHQAGIVHRDVKPGNVILLRDAVPDLETESTHRRLRASWAPREDGAGPTVERPLLTDFGLATDRTASKLSVSGMLIGTPGYMAPEQFQGAAQNVGPHSDQWALGVLLYECLTGRLPFPTGDLPTLARYVADEAPIAPSRLDPRIDRDLETISLKCLEKNPRDRYATCADLAADLRHWLRREPITARPPGTWRRVRTWARRRPARATAAGALLLAVLIGAGVLFGFRVSRANRIRDIADATAAAMANGDFARAEDLYGEWIALDPGAPRPRDGRERARANLRIQRAEETFAEAEHGMAQVRAGLETLRTLEAHAAEGQEVAGGRGLGSESARGSEPWWMREPAYRARIEIGRQRETLARQRAEVVSMLAVARSLVESSWRLAGANGRTVRDRVLAGSARWHMNEWRRAEERGDPEAAAIHRVAVEQLAPERYQAELDGLQTVRIAAPEIAADAWLFRYVREADALPRGGPRLLPLPFHPRGGLGPVPIVYERAIEERLEGEGRRPVAPDVPALLPPIRSDPQSRYIGTMAGPMLRSRYARLLEQTVYPLETSAHNALGRIEEPIEVELPPGRYLLLLRAEAHSDLCLPFELDGEEPHTIEPGPLPRKESVPAGFRWVPGGRWDAGSEAEDASWTETRGFLSARFEITYAEYWEFLNDARTIQTIEQHRADGLRFVPRYEGRSLAQMHVPRRPDESAYFYLMQNAEHPATYLNLYDFVGYLDTHAEGQSREEEFNDLADALAASKTVGWGYLRWRTERSRQRARHATTTGEVLPDVVVERRPDGSTAYRAMCFTLPTEAEWMRMAGAGDGRRFVYGDEREWLYFKGTQSRPQYPAPEPVGLFPEDESVFGIRDLAGSVSEWTADFHEVSGTFWVKGHSWGSEQAEDDRIAARRPLAPDTVSATVGFRLIVRVTEPVD